MNAARCTARHAAQTRLHAARSRRATPPQDNAARCTLPLRRAAADRRRRRGHSIRPQTRLRNPDKSKRAPELWAEIPSEASFFGVGFMVQRMLKVSAKSAQSQRKQAESQRKSQRPKTP